MKYKFIAYLLLLAIFSCDREEIDPDKYVLVPLIQTSRFPNEIQIKYYMPLWAFNESNYVYRPNAVNADRYDLFLSKGDTMHFEFLSRLNSDDQIYTYTENTEGEAYFFKIRASAKGVNPSYSNIAWVQGGENPEVELYDISVDNSFALCSVSPDGATLLYERNTSDLCCDSPDLMAYNIKTKTESVMVKNARHGSWGPDGSHIVFTSLGNTDFPQSSNLGLLSTATMNVEQISHGQNTFLYPVFSADGESFYCLNLNENVTNSWEILEYRLSEKSSNVVVPAGESKIVNSPFSFGKSSNMLAYERWFDDRANGISGYDLNSKTEVNIEQSEWYDFGPAFSNSGTYLAFLSSRTGRHEIWVKDIDEDRYFQLTGSEQMYIRGKLVWAPDDQKIYFKGYDSETYGVHSVKFEP